MEFNVEELNKMLKSKGAVPQEKEARRLARGVRAGESTTLEAEKAGSSGDKTESVAERRERLRKARRERRKMSMIGSKETSEMPSEPEKKMAGGDSGAKAKRSMTCSHLWRPSIRHLPLIRDPEDEPQQAILRDAEHLLNSTVQFQRQKKLILEKSMLEKQLKKEKSHGASAEDVVKRIEEKDNEIQEINKRLFDSEERCNELEGSIEELKKKTKEAMMQIFEKLGGSSEVAVSMDEKEVERMAEEIVAMIEGIRCGNQKLQKEAANWRVAANEASNVLEIWQDAYSGVFPNDAYLNELLGNPEIKDEEFESIVGSIEDLEVSADLCALGRRQKMLDLQLKRILGVDTDTPLPIEECLDKEGNVLIKEDVYVPKGLYLILKKIKEIKFVNTEYISYLKKSEA